MNKNKLKYLKQKQTQQSKNVKRQNQLYIKI